MTAAGAAAEAHGAAQACGCREAEGPAALATVVPGADDYGDGLQRQPWAARWTWAERASDVATATKLGDFFQYAIDKPVTLPRQKSALLPIVGKDVEGTRVSIYNERTQAKFPLLGLQVQEHHAACT